MHDLIPQSNIDSGLHGPPPPQLFPGTRQNPRGDYSYNVGRFVRPFGEN
jgi:hypothetical protein